jgi:hypothetical protein
MLFSQCIIVSTQHNHYTALTTAWRLELKLISPVKFYINSTVYKHTLCGELADRGAISSVGASPWRSISEQETFITTISPK